MPASIGLSSVSGNIPHGEQFTIRSIFPMADSSLLSITWNVRSFFMASRPDLLKNHTRPVLCLSQYAAVFAAPPVPMTKARVPLSISSLQSSAIFPKPYMSVLNPFILPPSILTVFTAPIAWAWGDNSCKSGIIAFLYGIVTLNPSIPESTSLFTSSSKRSFPISTSSYVPSMPILSKILLWISGDKLCESFSPIRAYLPIRLLLDFLKKPAFLEYPVINA